MHPNTVKLAVNKFRLSDKNLLKIVFNNQEFTYDNNIIVECYDTCLCLSSKLDDNNVHTVYIEYAIIMGVEVIEQG